MINDNTTPLADIAARYVKVSALIKELEAEKKELADKAKEKMTERKVVAGKYTLTLSEGFRTTLDATKIEAKFKITIPDDCYKCTVYETLKIKEAKVA